MPLRITEELDSLTVRVKGQGFVHTQIYLHSFFLQAKLKVVFFCYNIVFI